MSLPMNVLQSILSRNRTKITHLHEVVAGKCNIGRHNFLIGRIATGKDYYNGAKAISKDIAKLVAIQKALKEEMQTQISLQRVFKHPAKAVYE